MDTYKSPRGTLLVTIASMLIGVFYFIYISKVSFPHDTARIIPAVWLIGAISGLKMSLSTLRSAAWYIRLPFTLLAIASIFFAGIFSLAALMGD